MDLSVGRGLKEFASQYMPYGYASSLEDMVGGSTGQGLPMALQALQQYLVREQAQKELENKANELRLRYALGALTNKTDLAKVRQAGELGWAQIGTEKEKIASQERSKSKEAEAAVEAAKSKGLGELQKELFKSQAEQKGKKDLAQFESQLRTGEAEAQGKLKDRWSMGLDQASKTGLPYNPAAFVADFPDAIAKKNPLALQIHEHISTISKPEEYQQSLLNFADQFKMDPKGAMAKLQAAAQKMRATPMQNIAAPTPNPLAALEPGPGFSQPPGGALGAGVNAFSFLGQLLPRNNPDPWKISQYPEGFTGVGMP